MHAPDKKSDGAGGNHGGSPAMLRDIDSICKSAGVYPHAFLSGHAHNYQRFARRIRFGNRGFEIPFIICGDGGHNVNRMVKGKAGQLPREPHFGADVHYLENKPAVTSTGLILKHYDDLNYGYLRITVDKQKLQIGFHLVNVGQLAQSASTWLRSIWEAIPLRAISRKRGHQFTKMLHIRRFARYADR